MAKEGDRFHDNLRVFIRCRPVLPTDKTAVTDHSTFNLVRIIEHKLVVVLDPEKAFRESHSHQKSNAGDYPTLASDDSSQQKPLSKHHQHDVLRANRSREKRYAFDCAFDGDSTQAQVFGNCVEPLLGSVLDGYNATVFAYGQTGSGKTHTMLGPEESPGIMFRALKGLFERISDTSDHSYRVVISYLEVYNENIRDLLQPSDEYLELREDNDRMHVVGLTEIEVKNINQTMSLLRKGNQNRMQEETSHNKDSSRSHAVLQIMIEKRNKVKDVSEEVQVGKLSLIDLAGSERAAQTNNKGMRLREGANINRSLLALGNCINALGHRNNKGGYIPYRDSKLTRLLKDSLGGNCRTSMISCISPTNYEDTINTLKYANRAKNIKMTVSRNVQSVSHHIVHYTNIIGELKSEINNLKQRLIVTHKQLSWQKKQNSQANLLRKQNSLPNIHEDPEFDKLTQELMVNFEEMMQARKSVSELEALELANKIQINKLQLEMSTTRQTLSKSPIPERNSLQKSVSKHRKDIEDLVQNMRRNSRMKSEFQEKYDQLELLAITLKEKLKNAAADNPQKQEWLTQLFRLHLLELQNTELQSFQNKQQDMLREKDLMLKNLHAQLKVRDNMIERQREALRQFQSQDLDLPPSFIEVSEIDTNLQQSYISELNSIDEGISVPSSRNSTTTQNDDRILLWSPESKPLYSGDTISDMLPAKQAIEHPKQIPSGMSEKSSTPSPKRKKGVHKKNPFSTPPPQRRYSQQYRSPSRDNFTKKTKTKTSKRIQKKRTHRHKMLNKIYGKSPLGKKSPHKKRKDRQKSPSVVQELFTKKRDQIVDPNQRSRNDLHQARLRKQRLRQQNQRPKTLASSFHSDDVVKGLSSPERANSPDRSSMKSKSKGPRGGIVSSSLDSDQTRRSKESRFPEIQWRRRMQSIPTSKSYEDHFKKKLRFLEKQRQMLQKTP